MNQKELRNRFQSELDALKDNGIIQSNNDLAKRLGYSPQKLTEILKGRTKISLELLHDFCIQFNYSMDYLVFGKTNWKENNNTTTEKTESISTGKCESCTNKDSLISQLKAHIDDLRMMIDNYKGLTGDLLNDKNELKESLNRELERNQELYNSLKGNK